MGIAKFILGSGIGVFAFFVPVVIDGRSTILPDHLVTYVVSHHHGIANVYCLSAILVGVIAAFRLGNWRKSRTSTVLAIIQLFAIPLAVMVLTGRGPLMIMAPDMLPFIYERLAIPVGLIIPIGAVFLTFLLGFGLLEAVGSVMEPVMRPLFRTPGHSAVDAMASFAGSYSVGLLITNRVYKTGGYSAKDAAIIATGFSTVSATFMVVVAKTLALTEYWNAYFWSTLLITFLVTAITVRLPPLSAMSADRSTPSDDDPQSGRALVRAWRKGLQTAANAPPVLTLLRQNLSDGLMMAARVVPSILSVGLLGLLAAKYTSVFDLLGVLFYPVVWLFAPDNATLVSGFIASGLAEMFLPAIQAVDQATPVRFVVAVVSVSSVLFLSASIPCVLATEIPISLSQMLIVWLQRVMLSIPLAFCFTIVLNIS